MDGLKGLTDAKRHDKRVQEVFTPPEILQRMWIEWGEISLDTAADASRWVPARAHYIGADGQDGLALPWADRTYCNPEYAALRVWLEKATHEAGHGHRIALLVPCRSHRAWYRAAERTAHHVIELDPLAFWQVHPETGETAPYVHRSKATGRLQASTFPAPLAILCWNWAPDRDLWAPLGDVRRGGADL